MKDDLQKQAEYVEQQKAKNNAGMGLVFAEAFLRGIRDLGYKSPATALDELVDNSIQANATFVDIALAYDGKSQKQPTQIAVIDNGHGMLPDMIYFAVKWGGTHRENDRSGFGRYGYGLPSAAVSIAKRYTVYSKVADGEWHAVTVDIDKLAAIAKTGEMIDIPQPVKKKPPKYVMQRKKPIDVANLKSGTVVVLEDMDRMIRKPGWKQSSTISSKLLKHLGIIYRHIIPAARIFVNDEEVQIVDPLFLMEAGRFYDETPLMSEPVETPSFETETPTGQKGMVRIRASFLPANFQAVDPTINPKKAMENYRFSIMKEYNGLLICRAGRQIDCLSKVPWVTFQIYDRNIKIEIDFDPELDEFFGITTSKQQIVLDEGMWSRLEAAGVRTLIKDLRKKFRDSQAELEEALKKTEDEIETRSSEDAMLASEAMTPKPVELSPEKVQKAKEKLKTEAIKESKRTERPLEEVLAKIEEQTQSRPYRVDFQAIPDGPFYRAERLGLQKCLIINTQHSFYSNLYDSPDSSPEIQTALEVLLFVLADAELDAEGEFEVFYMNARKNWSYRLANALLQLDPKGRLRDKVSAIQEEYEVATTESLESK
jgi:hypothetical protein